MSIEDLLIVGLIGAVVFLFYRQSQMSSASNVLVPVVGRMPLGVPITCPPGKRAVDVGDFVADWVCQ